MSLQYFVVNSVYIKVLYCNNLLC